MKRIPIITVAFLAAAGLAHAQAPAAAPTAPAAPPPEPTISISPDYFYPFEEILYVEGRATPQAVVTVLFEREGDKPVKFTARADANGEWVVSEKAFLATGNWEVRAREQSPAGLSGWSNPRVIRAVVTGVSIFGLRVRYVAIAGILLAFLLIVAAVFAYFVRKIRRLKAGLFEKQLHDTQDRYRRGFAEIRKDLMDELKMLTAGAQGRAMTPEELERKDHILRELDELERTLSEDMGSIGKKM